MRGKFIMQFIKLITVEKRFSFIIKSSRLIELLVVETWNLNENFADRKCEKSAAVAVMGKVLQIGRKVTANELKYILCV